MLGDDSQAEDLVQQVFFKVWQNAGSYTVTKARFSTWLYRIATNCALDTMRASRARPEFASSDTLNPGSTLAQDEPPAISEQHWQRWQIARALAGLPAQQRTVIELAYYGELSQSEIADKTGLPLGTVKSRTTAGLRALRDTLSQREIVL